MGGGAEPGKGGSCLLVMGQSVQAGPGGELLPAGASQHWELPSSGCYTELMPSEHMGQVMLVCPMGWTCPYGLCWGVPCPLLGASRQLKAGTPQ